VSLFVKLNLIFFLISYLGPEVLLGLLVELFTFVGIFNFTAGILIKYFGFERTLHLVDCKLLFFFLGSHQLSSLLLLMRLVEQVLAKSIRAGWNICLTTSVLIDLRFEGVFIKLLLRLIVLCLCSTNEIVTVLTQSQVNFRQFLSMFDRKCELTLVINLAQKFTLVLSVHQVFILGFLRVHPRKTKILDCTHIDLRMLSLNFFLTVRLDLIRGVNSSEVAPYILKLILVWQTWLVNEAHLNESLKCLRDSNQGLVSNIIVVINLLQVTFETFENDILRIRWHWLRLRSPFLFIFYFLCILFYLISSFCVVRKDIFYFLSSVKCLRHLVYLRNVSWLRYFRRFPKLCFVFLAHLLFNDLSTFLADLGLELRSFCILLFNFKSKFVISDGFIFNLVSQKLLGASHVTPIIWIKSAYPFILCINFFLFFHLQFLLKFLFNHWLLIESLLTVLKQTVNDWWSLSFSHTDRSKH